MAPRRVLRPAAKQRRLQRPTGGTGDDRKAWQNCWLSDSAIIAERPYFRQKPGDLRMNERIESIRHADGVVELHMARADKMNALDPAMFDALIDAGSRLRDDASVRAVVIAGRGKAFCAGLDM